MPPTLYIPLRLCHPPPTCHPLGQVWCCPWSLFVARHCCSFHFHFLAPASAAAHFPPISIPISIALAVAVTAIRSWKLEAGRCKWQPFAAVFVALLTFRCLPFAATAAAVCTSTVRCGAVRVTGYGPSCPAVDSPPMAYKALLASG